MRSSTAVTRMAGICRGAFHERTGRHPTATLEMAAEMTLIEETDLRRDHRSRHSFEQQRLRALDTQPAQIAIRRRSVLLPEHRGKTRHAERGQRGELGERHRFVEMSFDEGAGRTEADGLFHDV